MRSLAFYGVAGAVLAADQATKHWAMGALESQGSLPVVDSWLALTLVRNSGSAFGLVRNASLLLAVFAVLAVVVLVVFERRGLPTRAAALATGLVLGGALGNLSDRLRYGYVIDFVDFQYRGRNVFPVFNVADSAITVGAALILLAAWRAERRPLLPGSPDAAD